MPSRRLLLTALPVTLLLPALAVAQPCCGAITANGQRLLHASTHRASITCGCRTSTCTGRPASSTTVPTAGRRRRIAAPSSPPSPSSSASTSCARPIIPRCCWPTPRCAGCHSTAPRRAGAACPTPPPPSRAPTSATWWSPSSRIPTAHRPGHIAFIRPGSPDAQRDRGGGPRRHAGRRHQRALDAAQERLPPPSGAWPTRSATSSTPSPRPG